MTELDYSDQRERLRLFLEEQSARHDGGRDGFNTALREQDDFWGYRQVSFIHEPCIIIGDRSLLKIGKGSRIDSFTKIEIGNGLIIGSNVHVASFAHIGIGGGHLTIADGVTVSSGAKIISATNMPEALSMSPLTPKGDHAIDRSLHTIIGRNAAVLCNAVIMPGVRIGEGARVGAGAVVTRDVPAGETWVGVPAKRRVSNPWHDGWSNGD